MRVEAPAQSPISNLEKVEMTRAPPFVEHRRPRLAHAAGYFAFAFFSETLLFASILTDDSLAPLAQ